MTSLDIISQAKEHASEWGRCTRCMIGEFAHKHVFYRGVIPCDILFVGEAPGKTEDATGIPFVGKSGKLLEYWIQEAQPDTVMPEFFRPKFTYAITNLVSCRPCDRRGGPNRPPSLQEVANCSGRLAEFVVISKPKGIVAVGRQAEGKMPMVPGVPRGHILHPSYVLRNGETPDRPGMLSRQEIQSLAKFVRRVQTTEYPNAH